MVSVFSLRDPICRNAELVGSELLALSSACDVVPVAATVIATAKRYQWHRTADMPCGLYERLPGDEVTVRCWVLGAVDGERDRAVGPVFNNIQSSTVNEVVIELLGCADRLGATQNDRIVISVQRFKPADATVLATMDHGESLIRLRACYGVSERLAEPLYFDEFRLFAADLRLAGACVVRKIRATIAARGGTRTATVSWDRQGIPAIGINTAITIARLAREVSAVLADTVPGDDFELEFTSARYDSIRLLRCRPQRSTGRAPGSAPAQW